MSGDHFLLFLLVLLLDGGRGGSGQSLCSERSSLWRKEPADTSEARESSWKRAVVYLKLLTTQSKKTHNTDERLHVSETTNCTEDKQMIGSGHSKQRCQG